VKRSTAVRRPVADVPPAPTGRRRRTMMDVLLRGLGLLLLAALIFMALSVRTVS
jgi:hypothetical protein